MRSVGAKNATTAASGYVAGSCLVLDIELFATPDLDVDGQPDLIADVLLRRPPELNHSDNTVFDFTVDRSLLASRRPG